MNLTYFQIYIKTFDSNEIQDLSAFEFLEKSIKSIQDFETNFIDSLNGLPTSSSEEIISQIRYSLNRKISEYHTGLEQIDYWLNSFGITYNELLMKPENDLVAILNINNSTDKQTIDILQNRNPYLENIQEQFFEFGLGGKFSTRWQ